MCGNILVCAVEVPSGRRHPRSLQVHCQFLFQSVSFLKSQFEMWLQLIVTPQRPFQTNDVGTTSSKAWQHYPKYRTPQSRVLILAWWTLVLQRETWRTKHKTPYETNWMPWSLQSFFCKPVRRTCFQTVFCSTFNRRLNPKFTQQGVWSQLHVAFSHCDRWSSMRWSLGMEPKLALIDLYKGSFNIYFQHRKLAIRYTSEVHQL